ncbi:MAG: hypothetical protein NZ555_05115 [Geminicoccaceae bacterium]|nr:hypothetical protein [Geminicoccaceae bacterium]
MNPSEALLLELLDTMRRTGAALRRVRRRLAGRFPVSAERLAGFDEDTTAWTDALLKRVEQMVDAHRSATRVVVKLIGEEDKYRTQRQILDRLASFDVVPDPLRVLKLIELRNRTVHAYAPESEKQAGLLNEAWAAIPELLDLAARLARFVREEKLLPAAAGPVLAAPEALAAPI